MILSLTLNPGLTLQHQPIFFHNNTILKFKKKIIDIYEQIKKNQDMLHFAIDIPSVTI